MVVLIYTAFAMPTIKVIIHFMQSSQFAMLKKSIARIADGCNSYNNDPGIQW